MADSEMFRVRVEDPPPLPYPDELETAARRAAESDGCLLLLGERGTGKTVLARRIHDWSRRSDESFERVDLASLAGDLLQSELFGHVKGAFTGAVGARNGMIRKADGGTVLLDEISALGPRGQGNLLTLLQERRVRAVGSDRWKTVDVRVICATNQDLRAMTRSGRFRADLYDRCTRMVLLVSPLRERLGNLQAIVRRVIWAVLRDEHPRGLREVLVARGALGPLDAYGFPGNLRELASIMHHALLTVEDGALQRHDTEAALRERKRLTVNDIEAPDTHILGARRSGRRYRRTSTSADERAAIVEALARTRGNRRKAAERLRMSERTLYRKLGYHGIADEEWQEAAS